MSKDYQSLDDAELKKRYEPENGGITSLIKCIANLRRRLDDGEMNIEKIADELPSLTEYFQSKIESQNDEEREKTEELLDEISETYNEAFNIMRSLYDYRL